MATTKARDPGPPRSEAGMSQGGESSASQTRRAKDPPAYWLPNEWAEKQYDPIFVINAASSGDMYHVRAAMHYAPNCALVIHSSNPQDTRAVFALETYLDLWDTRVAESKDREGKLGGLKRVPTLRTTWNAVEMQDKDHKGVSGTAWYNGKQYQVVNSEITGASSGSFSSGGPSSSLKLLQMSHKTLLYEGHATITVARDFDVKNPPIMTTLSLSDGVKAYFKTIVDANYKFLTTSGKKNVLVFHRISGTGTKGAHPEYDTGDDEQLALGQLVRLVNEYPTSGFNAILSGNGKPIGKFDSLGEYFRKLDPPDDKLKGHSKRDIEAAFQKYLFQEHFKLDDGSPGFAIGFRSGAVDLLTFMLIPTVSIGLREYMAEDRTLLLSQAKFKRLNIQYDTPRHYTTKRNGDPKKDSFAMEARDPPLPLPLKSLTSPWWWYNNSMKERIMHGVAGDGKKIQAIPAGETDDEKAERMWPVQGFTTYDFETVRTGIWHAFGSIGKVKAVFSLDENKAVDFPFVSIDPTIPMTVTARVVRGESNLYRRNLTQDATSALKALDDLRNLYIKEIRDRLKTEFVTFDDNAETRKVKDWYKWKVRKVDIAADDMKKTLEAQIKK